MIRLIAITLSVTVAAAVLAAPRATAADGGVRRTNAHGPGITNVKNYGEIFILPRVLNTGVSNITAAFTIACKSTVTNAWTTFIDHQGFPPWAAIDPPAGQVAPMESVAVPVTVYRNLLPSDGVYTASIGVAIMPLTGTSSWQVISNAVTLLTRVVSNQAGLVAAIHSGARAYAGVPFHLDARGSQGWIDEFYWVTNYDRARSVESQAFASNVVDKIVFHEPDRFDLSLFVVDHYGRVGRADIRDFTVWNSQPKVDPDGPYYTRPGDVVLLVATGQDPNPDEQLLYSWQYDPPWGPFTPMSANPTGAFVCTRTRNFYVVCTVSDTWTGVVGTYNGPRGNRSFSQIIVTNEPPTVSLRYRFENQPWSAWSNTHTLILPALSVTSLVAEVITADRDSAPASLTVEWREYAGNPTHGLINPGNRYSNSVGLAPFAQPGWHAFSVRANDGVSRSIPATLYVGAPGVKGLVVADGFQSRVPVWGVFASPGVPGNTNALGVPDDPVATLSDVQGRFTLDRTPLAEAFVQLERDAGAGEVRSYTFTPGHNQPAYAAANVFAEHVFDFPVKTYDYGGQLLATFNNGITGIPNASVSLVMHPGTRIRGQCNEVGSFSFGKLPQPSPLCTGETCNYYFVFLKPGHNSLCVKRTPDEIAEGRINERFELPVDADTIALCGTVRGSRSRMPVPHARVRFGAHMVHADRDGVFCFSNLPRAVVSAPGDPTHVLVADADGYDTTINVLTNTADGGDIDVWLDGGAVRVYGTVYDPAIDNVATGAVISVPHPPVRGYRVVNEGPSEYTSDSGYYDIEVPGGCEYVTIESRDRYQEVPIPPDHSGDDPLQLDIELVPEPGASVVLLVPVMLARARRAAV